MNLFENDAITIIMIFSRPSFTQTQMQNDLLSHSVDGKHLKHFQSETSVFKFLWRSVDGSCLATGRNNCALKTVQLTILTELRIILYNYHMYVKSIVHRNCLQSFSSFFQTFMVQK